MNRPGPKPLPGPSRAEVERAVEMLNRRDFTEIRGAVDSVLDAATRGGARETEMMVVSVIFGLWVCESQDFKAHKKAVEPYLRGRQNLARLRDRETPIRLKSGKTIIRLPVLDVDVRRVGELTKELGAKAPNISELDRRIARRLRWPVDVRGLRRVRTLREKARKLSY